MSTSKKNSSTGSSNLKDNANGEGSQGNSERRDKGHKKATTELNNVQQQETSQSNTSQEQAQPDKIPEMTDKEEKTMKYVTELETLRGRVKTLEEENKKLHEELSNEDIRTKQPQEGIDRKLQGQKTIHFEGQPKIGDEDQKKATTEGNNGQQQQNSQPNTSQDQSQSDKIPEMTGEEEKKMKYVTELETLRGRVKNLEEENKRVKELEGENKKFSEDLSNKEIRIMQLQEEIDRKIKGQKNIRLEDQPKVGRPDRPRSAQPLSQRHVGVDPAELQKKIDEQRSRIESLMVQDAQKKEECDRYCNQRDALNVKLKHCENLLTSLKEEKLEAEKKIGGLKKEKDELLNRLSKIASDRLTYENTDITDLSDEIRPTKLAEKMSELYDNQWTSAFDELKTNKFVDEDAIRILLKILLETHQVCKEMTLSRYQKLNEICSCFEFSSSADGEDKPKDRIITKIKLSIELQQDIKRIWRESSKKCLKEASPIIEKKVADKFEFLLLEMRQTPVYLKECVELCWMMNLQEKPMHLDVSVQEKDGHPCFNSEKFRSYTNTGQYIAFVVWPALYLNEGGPVLKKGVAQGLKVPKGTCEQDDSSTPRS